ncbi:glutamate synthase-related protein [Nocardiopsis metallicus]|uniref:Glutamate synthase domain-containing protein 2/nitrite reductase/ring-hydroxylating ferredoxin subunit n=1 Tax=Nocardiopsis metallicus TaxID=179819 RepID=A0A840WJZ5_9ACTN|nr:glutamate synthase-related protein [Nocardiopsis metallicus]MBB5491997.1 glutamate synthase domain-containing protein 2/nitrite reductase/ring-hydroxylating ferredoxin subunit [Nocardiopsis metallicus]
MRATKVADWDDLVALQPAHALISNVDLAVIRLAEATHTEGAEGTEDARAEAVHDTQGTGASDGRDLVRVLYGRCQHRGALMSDATVHGNRLVCGVHGSTYDVRSGTNLYYQGADLKRFDAWVGDGGVWVDADEVLAWERDNPQNYDRSAYQGAYADFKGTPDEPFNGQIHRLASDGLSEVGHHGQVEAMGVPRSRLPSWDDLQIITAQLHTPPLLDDHPVGTRVVIGPNARRPLVLDIPVLVSDMSFGALSAEAKTALARGAELAGTGICSGEGGMLPEEQRANSRYFYELASARFGYSLDKVVRCQAFHFKGGQAAKTGTGGHLPGHKVSGRIAEVRELPEGEPAVSPARFPDLVSVSDFRRVAEEVRQATGGVPVGFKLSAQHIERDLEAALQIGVDYVILDGRGGGTGAAPLLFRENISVPTIPALARARRHLDRLGRGDVTLIITGGLRVPADFVKALALGADAIAVSNSAIQSIGCLGMRACHTNNCPVGIATQQPHLRERLPVAEAAERLNRFLRSSVELMQVMARACGHDHLGKLNRNDLVAWKRELADLSGVAYGGVGA